MIRLDLPRAPPLDRLAAEGEGCGAVPNGITRAAPDIATGAGAADATAATSAPM